MNWLYCNISDFSETEYAQASVQLSQSRKKRIERMKMPLDKKRSLASGLLLKRLLSEKYGIEDALLENRENGSPFLVGTDLFVSISHSEEMVACAVSERPVGIDIELIKPINLAVCRKVCVEDEAVYIFGKIPNEEDYCYCENEEILRRFFEIWTAKEAYFKMLGTGITDFKTVNVLSLKRQSYSIGNYYVQIVTE